MLVDDSDKTMMFICTLAAKRPIAEQCYVTAVVKVFNVAQYKKNTET